MGKESIKETDPVTQAMDRMQADITFTKSELVTLKNYLGITIIDVESMKARGLCSAAVVDRLYSVRGKIKAAIKQIEERNK